MPFKALVVGGAGDMGRWCSRLLKQSGFEVSISSRRPDIMAIAESLGAGVASVDYAGQFDVVVLSVPIDAIEGIAAQVGPRMKPGSLLMDLSSLKTGPVEAMLKYAPESVEVIGAHPLFGPGLETLEGRTIVLVPTGRSGRWLSVMRDVFETAGAAVEISTPGEHDRKMAIVQGLTHFLYISWGRAIQWMDVDLRDLEAYRTPVYGVTETMAGRVLAQNPELYALIQSGHDVAPVRKAFIEACTELAAMIDAGDLETFKGTFSAAAAHYGDLEGAKERSERIVRLGQGELAAIKKSAGLERAFVLPGGRKVYGTVKELQREDFTLETPSETLVLRYDAVSMLGPEGLSSLKDGSPSVGRDILVKLPIGADVRVLGWVLTRIDGVTGVSHETRNAMGPDHVLYRLTVGVRPERSEDTLQRVLATIWGLGYEVK
ncbi:prephenate dehydrogenase/arogenate dehydrogenase family protein [Methanocella arvoryzae]|uniref:Prephenate dehydrogenase n=1 Tax=Methanocella arvoryzae (strain DSM 22066 / NBRC 105507 / MRE50) TaxID=351160 RepID=Q0W4U2_METAR|nr:prephenate dehydrogenase/arogenate dehydrogenase family protein [Methanocella arvoryzae]CAJ36601.1 putative prephenate dehydrogenase [Methanocella arvoryzae MRE50]